MNNQVLSQYFTTFQGSSGTVMLKCANESQESNNNRHFNVYADSVDAQQA